MNKFIRTICIVFLTGATMGVTAQNLNIQLHCNYGNWFYENQVLHLPLTATVETFVPDKLGSTYFFVDFDYNGSVGSAYFELSREFCFWNKSKVDWLTWHVEYNGGLSNAFSFNDAYLTGVTGTYCSSDFTKSVSLGAYYKYIREFGSSFQVTSVWNVTTVKGWLTFCGYIDISMEHARSCLVRTEPQMWVNLHKNFALGGELLLYKEFNLSSFYVIPTVAFKWTII